MTTSIVVHALLVLLLMWLTIQVPDPPLPQGGGSGMELGLADLGFSDVGMGDIEDEQPSTPAESTPVPTEQGDVIAEEDGEPINVPVKDPDKPASETPAVKPPKKQPPKISEPTVSKGFQNAINNAWNKGNSSGQTPGTGNQGAQDGTAGGLGGGGGTGGGQGGGQGGGTGPGIGTFGPVSFVLENRGVTRRPDLSQKPLEGGKVVLNIFVDRTGKVVRTTPNLTKSKTTSTALFDLARKMAMTAVFTADPQAAAEQRGEMTFNFELE
jgi:periplasmic protein TonB